MKYKLRGNYSTDPDEALISILEDRGVKDIENFLNPSFQCELNPYDLENIEAAAELLLKHLRANSKILLVIDCDADGYSSGSVLWLYIKDIFPDAQLSFTVHEHKQHGLDDKIDWIETQDFNLILCPDAASYDVEPHARLAAAGIDMIALDHHAQEYDKMGNPIVSNFPNIIIVNNQLSPNYANKSLCGAGVTYKFCEVLDDLLELEDPRAFKYQDLVALGEIADVMDRTDTETNYLMLSGLANIQNAGFAALIEAQAYSLKEKATAPYTGLTPIDVAFYIAPLINAITRVGTIAEKENMFYCFTDPTRMVRSTKRGALPDDLENVAEQTARVGKNAKARQDRLKEKAIEVIDYKIQKDGLLDNNIILVELTPQDKIPQELTGLVAMAIVSKYHKPCMIGRRNGKNEVQGSIRSDGNFSGLPNFKEFLENSGVMDYVAGRHIMALNTFSGCHRGRISG